MASVTVPSGTATPIGQIFGNASNSLLANQIATAIANAAKAHTLGLTNITVPGAIPSPPANPGGVNELIISAGGDYTIPASTNSQLNPDYVVVLNSKDPVTIHGASNSSIWGGAGQVTIVDPAAVTLSEGASNPVVTLTGDGDLLAANNSAETVTASGTNETILVGGGQANVTLTSGSSGALVSGSTVVGHAGGLDVTDSGLDDTVSAGSASAAVTLAGSGALVSGGTGALSVVDNGFSDTINAGSGFTAVDASGADSTSGSLVNGGSGQLNFVGGAGGGTVVGATAGGAGNSTVFGGTGLTSLVGGPGGAVTYVNTTSGGLWVNGGTGDETIDASLSKGTSTIYGGQDTAGRNLLMGGAGTDFINAGSGSDTLVGGGGQNDFFFIKALGGPAANDVVSDFSAIDTVFLLNYGSGEAGAAVAGATTAGGSTTITLSDNTKITFTGVTDPATLNGHIIST
jgi:Ca2+-binding RTX toxin-like protein